MRITVNKGCGNIIGNTLRQVALTQLPVIRPIAIKVGETCNVLTAGKDVQEDMTTIISNLTSITYSYSGDDSVVVVQATANGVLRASDLAKNGITICSGDDDKVILTTMGVPVAVAVYFRVGTGVATIQDNTIYLNNYGVTAKDLVVFVSRHSQIVSFAYTVKEQAGGKDLIDLTIVSNTDRSEEDIFSAIKSELLAIIQSL